MINVTVGKSMVCGMPDLLSEIKEGFSREEMDNKQKSEAGGQLSYKVEVKGEK